MSLFPKKIQVGARDSLLSKVQVEEVLQAIQEHHPEIEFATSFLQTKGDKDQLTSLLHLGKSDFFTKELDDLLLNKECRITIHSAKDLPEPLPKGLTLIACTKGQDSSDVLVLKKGEKSLASGSKVGTSSLRRIENVKKSYKSAICVDIRGTIEKRLMLLEEGKVDALVLPTAALLRLKLHANTIPLPGESCPLQGRLAILAREGDLEMQELFSLLDSP